MEINNINNKINNTSFASKAENNKKICNKKCEYRGEIDFTSESLKLIYDKPKEFEGQRIYFVNKDGSGRYVTPRKVISYSKETLSDVLTSAKKMCNKNNSAILTEENIKDLINAFEEKAEIVHL